MRKLTRHAALAALALILGTTTLADTALGRVVLESRGPRHHRMPAEHEFVLEGGLAEPAGDQTDDFWDTENGFDATTGYQFGVRFRQFMGTSLAVAPAFHYTRFGDAEGVGDFGSGAAAYRLKTSSFRYGLDLQAQLGVPGEYVRPYITGGVALMHNRYRDELQYEGFFETSVNSPAFSAGMGIRMGNFEISGEYTFNRFSTANLTPDIGTQDYNWDYFVVRMGIALGR